MLGPLLFFIYINDFHKCSDLFEFHHFADDSNLFYKHKTLLDLESDANRELIKINEWLCVNEFFLNIEKSNFIIFQSYQRRLDRHIVLCISGIPLKQVE